MLFNEGYLERVKTLSPSDLLKLISHENPAFFRNIAHSRFGQEAKMMNNNDQAPFILWPAINHEPYQAWLPVLLAKVAAYEFSPFLYQTERLIVIGVPKSATWYPEQIQKNHIFQNATYPPVLKETQISQPGLDINQAYKLPVPSYVHGRNPKTDARSPQDIFFFHPQIYKRKILLILDDALAQGISADKIAEFAKTTLGVEYVLVATPMAKQMEGGLKKLIQSPYIDGVSVLINITQTHGKGNPIDYKIGGCFLRN